MPWPNVKGSEDFETFFEPTRIFMFGKEFRSLKFERGSMDEEFTKDYVAPAANHELPLPPRRIERTLRRQSMENGKAIDRIFARIYSFSFEGYYYKLPRPMLFLVSGAGELLQDRQPAGAELNGNAAKPAQNGGAAAKGERAKRRPGAAPQNEDPHSFRLKFNTKFTGLDAREWVFSEDIRVWQVDRKDMTVCLDVEVGNYQEILLDTMIAASRRAASSRGEIASRGEISSRGEIGSRGASSFRGEIVGPHHNW
jgi:hypothetical protein